MCFGVFWRELASPIPDASRHPRPRACELLGQIKNGRKCGDARSRAGLGEFENGTQACQQSLSMEKQGVHTMWGGRLESRSPRLRGGAASASPPAASGLLAEGASGPVGTAPCPGWVWSRALDLNWLRVLARSRAEVGLSGGLGSCAFLFSKLPSGSASGIFVGISGPAALASQGRVRHVDSQTGQSEALGCPPPPHPARPSGAKGVRCPGRGRCYLPWGLGQSQGGT